METQSKALVVSEEQKGGARVLKLEGSFNRESARMLRALLEQWPEDRVVLDFSRVHEFLVPAVVDVTRGLESRAIQVSGLPGMCEQIFRCFGWPAFSPENRAYYISDNGPVA
jgi:hypothetical protein